MKNFTSKLTLFLTFLFISVLGIAQETYTTVGIIGTATENGWISSTPMKLADPNNPHQWILRVQLTQGELKFRANDSWDVNWGGTEFPTGTGTRNGADILVPTESYYTIHFNDITGAYHFEVYTPSIYETVGIVGDATASGWNNSIAMVKDPVNPHLWTLDHINLTDGEIKFRANNAWDVSWGGAGFPSGIAFHTGSNISVNAGEYAVIFNDLTGEYFFEAQAQTYETIGIIGTATELGWDVSTPMEAVIEGGHEWKLTTYLFAGELKFRANNSWDMSWGGSSFPSGTGSPDGNNIVIPSNGYYSIKFNDYTGNYSFTLLNPTSYDTIGIVGDATAAGWNTSTPMIKGEDGHTWTIENLELTTGEVKFRANNSWEVNWGGSDFPTGEASFDGPNIPINAGIYSVTFNDFTKEYNFTKTGAVSGGIVTLSPNYPTANEPVSIIYDATQGTSGLVGADKVYLHSGVILSGPEGTEWNYTVGNWGQDDGIGEMTKVDGEENKWQITIPSIREYFGVEAGIPIFRLGMVFRNADGSLVGKSETNGDIFVDTNPGDYIRFTEPTTAEIFGLRGDDLLITAETSSTAQNIKLQIDEGEGYMNVAEVTNSSDFTFNYTLGTANNIKLKITALLNNGTTVTALKEITVYLREPNTIAALPEGMTNGINYHPDDPTKATLVLLAPGKEFVYVVGDFNNWEVQGEFQMNQTPDGEYFWIQLNNLEPKKEYIFQYWVEGVIKIGDPYAHKVVDPYRDDEIPEAVYPGLIDYNKVEYGLATVLQTNQEAYQWEYPEVVGGKPANEDLVIYELLVRDFVESHSYDEVIEKLPYLKELGVNAIELMPVMEFENNDSWGYNPSYLFAPDKFYGTENDLKRFIDKAHEMGFVVLLDMVLNHQFGQSPMVRMYFDEEKGRPSADSPWFNQIPTHPYNVGYDFNHESTHTKNYIDDVNRYWLEEFNFDGYRFDLTKGFTQTNNLNNVGAWSAYDQSRIDILKRMTHEIWEYEPEAYVIMEHLAVNSEEKVLADFGILLWGNMNHSYSELVLGQTNIDLNWALSSTRGWNNKNLIAYMESHDEQRLMYKALEYGFSAGDYNIQEEDTALERIKLASAFYYPVPGPKMIWQFGELGYDFPINYNGRTGNKPIPWSSENDLNYHQDEDRMRLYKTVSAINNLVNGHSQIFEGGHFSWTPNGSVRRINISHPNMNVTIVGNFGVTDATINPQFQKEGKWYDFFSGQEFKVISTTQNINLEPGEFQIFVDKPVSFPEAGLLENVFVKMMKPSNFTVEIQGTNSVKLVWEDNSAGETGYMIQRRSEDATGFTTIATLDFNIEAYLDSEIIDGMNYEYRVRALNPEEGNSEWSSIQVVDLELYAPTHLSGKVPDPNTINLFWTDVSNHESTYIIERSEQYGNTTTAFVPIAELPANTIFFSDSDVVAGKYYSYRIYAQDSDEKSIFSNTLKIRPAEELQNQLLANVVMSPNPTSNVVNVEVQENVSQTLHFVIYNFQGLKMTAFEIGPENRSFQIEVANWREGIYILHKVGTGNEYSKLLMVKH